MKNRIIGVLLVIVVLLGIDGTPFIFSDSYCYYHTAKSLATTGRWVTTLEPEYMIPAHNCVRSVNRKYVTIVPPGTALFEAPFLFLAQPFDFGTVTTDYFKAFNGHSLADGIAVLLSGITFGCLGLYLSYRALRKLKFSSAVAGISIGVGCIASYLYSYMYEIPGFPHVFEFFSAAGLLNAALSYNNRVVKRRWVSSVIVGIFSGLLVIVRPTDILIAMPILVFVLLKSTSRIRDCLFVALGGIPFILLLFSYNYVSYGNILTNGYSYFSGSIFSLSQNHLVDLLFSCVRGWFIYSPIFLVSIVALIIFIRKRVEYVLLTIIPIVLVIGLYSFFPYWWAGHSIGNRFFIVLVPFVAVGLAHLLEILFRLKGKAKLLLGSTVVLLTAYSLFLGLLMRVTPLQRLHEFIPSIKQYNNVPISESATVKDILSYHRSIIERADSGYEYFQNLKSGFQGGRSLLLVLIGETKPIVQYAVVSSNIYELTVVPNLSSHRVITDVVVTIERPDEVETITIEKLDFSLARSIRIDCRNVTDCMVDYPYVEVTNEVEIPGSAQSDSVITVDGRGLVTIRGI